MEKANLKKLCRLCLSTSFENFKSKSCDEFLISRNLKILISEMIKECTSVLVNQNDGFSFIICSTCEISLLNSYNFRQLALESQKTLRSVTQMKVEDKNLIQDKIDHDNDDKLESPHYDDDYNSEPEKIDLTKNNLTVVRTVKSRKRGEDKHPGLTEIIEPHLVELALQDVKSKSDKRLDCSVCGFTSSSPRGLTSHVIQIHPDLDSKWCRLCYSIVENLPEHVKNHKKERNYKCQFCTKTFFRNNNLIEHLKLHLGNTQNCDICNRKFSSLRNLKKHKDTHTPNTIKQNEKREKLALEEPFSKNTDEKPYLCPHCGKGFFRKFSVISHIRIHTGEKPFTCKECNTSFASKSILSRHITIHTGRPYYCKLCSQRFLQRTGLTRHMESHTGEKSTPEKPEQCLICLKRFKIAYELKIHMRKHTGEKPFSCSECNRSYSEKRILAKHMLTHTDLRPFVCTYCNKAFRNRSNWQDHMKIHTGEKPFKCKFCNYATIKNYNLRQHMRKHSLGDTTLSK